MSFRKPDPEDIIESLNKLNNESEAMKLLKASNFWVRAGELENVTLPLYMVDEELIYLANVMYKLPTINQQRALIDVMHVHCDEETLQRFMNLFPEGSMGSLMLSC